MSRDKLSSDSITEASRTRAEYSGHDGSIGTGGFKAEHGHGDAGNCEYLSNPGQRKAIVQPKDGFPPVHIGLSWNNTVTEKLGFFQKMVKKATKQGVDLDLGCLYELKNGERGCIQAFGEKFGEYDSAPFIALSGDERTGDAEGDDEIIRINAKHWGEVERVLVYCYIYKGPTLWSEIKPNLNIIIEGQTPINIQSDIPEDTMNICALVNIKNEKDGMHFTNNSEYFHDHAAMDRAFGFGIEWGDGQKN